MGKVLNRRKEAKLTTQTQCVIYVQKRSQIGFA